MWARPVENSAARENVHRERRYGKAGTKIDEGDLSMKMKKLLSVVMATAMLAASMVIPALATDYQSVSFTSNDMDKPVSVTIDKAVLKEEDAWSYDSVYAVPVGATITIVPKDWGQKVLLTFKDENSSSKMMILKPDGTLLTGAENIDQFTRQSMTELWLEEGVSYTITITEDLAKLMNPYTDNYKENSLLLSMGKDGDFGIPKVIYLVLDEGSDDTAQEVALPTAFKDVAADDYFVAPVQWAVENEITAGTSATTFGPYDTCTQAQIVTFLWKANGAPVVDADNPYSTVTENDYYYKAVVWAASKGIIDDSFSPNNPCTRATAVTYMYNNAGKPSVETGSKFSDISGASYENAVYWALENGVTSGTSDTTFSPDDTCTRAQIMTFLYKGLAK
jgi:hypothetical protein